MYFKASTVLCICTALFLCAAGCSSTSPTSATKYEAPGWMAEQRQQTEEIQAAVLSCMEEHGAGEYASIVSTGTVGLSPPEGMSDDDYAVFEATYVPIYEACTDVSMPESHAANEADYQKILDTRACLINEGYAIPEPPSMETWLEEVNSPTYVEEIWSPYMGFGDDTAPFYFEVSTAEVYRLNEVCPQGPHGAVFLSDGNYTP